MEKTENFIERAKEIHGDKYDYSKVEYKSSHTEVCIICPIHGEFWQKPFIHLRGCGCKKCVASKKRKTTEQFIDEAKKVHGDKYDYSKVDYVNCGKKVCIICPKHGEFWQTPNHHLNGYGCPSCVGKNKSKEYFLEKAKEIHGDKYDYSKVEYKKWEEKVCIICPKHGEFWQTPYKHINEKHNCPNCSNRVRLTKEEFIEKARKIHGDKYDYSKVEYINHNTAVCIICPKHGEFWQKPSLHLMGNGCSKCNGGVKMTKEEFIEKAKSLYLDRYDYSKVKYINARTKVCIICPKHGEFWQTPDSHLHNHECPKCSQSKCENKVEKLLADNNIEYVVQKSFNWLKKIRNLKLDFYLPKYKIAIECQGEQHFKPIDAFGGETTFKEITERDKIKKDLCDENGIQIVYYSLFENENTINNLDVLLEKIKSYETSDK